MAPNRGLVKINAAVLSGLFGSRQSRRSVSRTRTVRLFWVRNPESFIKPPAKIKFESPLDPFRNFKSSKSADQQILRSSETSCDGFLSSLNEKTKLERADLSRFSCAFAEKEKRMFIFFFLPSFCQLLSPPIASLDGVSAFRQLFLM